VKRLAVALLWLILFAIAVKVGGDDPNPAAASQTPATAAGTLVQGKPVQWWARRAVQARKDANARGQTIRRLRQARLVQFRPPYEHAAKLAAIAFGVDAGTLIRKGRCESARWTRFTNHRSHALGPWQFLPSTWSSTPYASFSPYDADAAALAAARMHAHGRGSEWSCQ
jgi:hypothetical protein